MRFVGFGAEEDEWVNVKNDVRERSIPLENWECQKVKPGDVMLCLQVTKKLYHFLFHSCHGLRHVFTFSFPLSRKEKTRQYTMMPMFWKSKGRCMIFEAVGASS